MAHDPSVTGQCVRQWFSVPCLPRSLRDQCIPPLYTSIRGYKKSCLLQPLALQLWKLSEFRQLLTLPGDELPIGHWQVSLSHLLYYSIAGVTVYVKCTLVRCPNNAKRVLCRGVRTKTCGEVPTFIVILCFLWRSVKDWVRPLSSVPRIPSKANHGVCIPLFNVIKKTLKCIYQHSSAFVSNYRLIIQSQYSQDITRLLYKKKKKSQNNIYIWIRFWSFYKGLQPH